MRVTFVAMGWENISIQYLSAYLQHHGHDCSLAYDQCLFDDKNYVSIPSLAKVFYDGSSVIEQILDSKPNLVCFSVMSVMHDWAVNVSRCLKQYLDVPILFGGYHPTGAPIPSMENDVVDMICIGEGENALLELCDSLEKGENRTDIRGIYFRENNGKIIMNSPAAPVEDLDKLPFVDKDLFRKHTPMESYMLMSLARGCVYNCSYCAVSINNQIARDAGIRAFRYPSPERAIEEIKSFQKDNNFKWIDFRHAVFGSSPKWIIDFCSRYKEEVGVPFRVFMHPSLIRDDVVFAMVDAGCFTIQMGLESFDEELRKKALNRHETNKAIYKAIEIFERNKAKYTLDYILGLPGQTEKELMDVANLFSGLKHCYRLSPFMCQYLPGSPMIQYALDVGAIQESDVHSINEGKHDNYMDEGSIAVYSDEWQRTLRMYRVLFRTMGLMPSLMRKLLMKSRAYRFFFHVNPRNVIKFLDIIIVIADKDARGYFMNYLWWLSRRLIPSHPTFFLRKTKIKELNGINFLYDNLDEKQISFKRRKCPTPPDKVVTGDKIDMEPISPILMGNSDSEITTKKRV